MLAGNPLGGLCTAKSRLRLSGRATVPTGARKLRAKTYVRALPLRAGSAGAQPAIIDPATVVVEDWSRNDGLGPAARR